jgi:hypothetical protein
VLAGPQPTLNTGLASVTTTQGSNSLHAAAAAKTAGHTTHHHQPEIPLLTYNKHHKIHFIPASRHNHIQASVPSGFQLVNQGGPVLTNVEVEAVFLGDYWNTSDGQALATQIDGFFSYITSSPYFGILSQYGINPGTFTGQTVIATAFPQGTTLDDSAIQAALQDAITSGALSLPDSNTLLAVYTEPNVSITLNGDSSTSGLLGYHSSFTGADAGGNGFTVSYSVVAHPTGNTPIVGLKTFADLTAVSSHELAEAVTDPQPLTNPTWVDPNTGEEVGDPGEGQFGVVNNITVQALWSNNDGGVVLPGSVVQNGITVSVNNIQSATAADFTGTVATFVDPTGTGAATDYQAVIDWGDGITSLGTISVTTTPAAKTAAHVRHHHGRHTDTTVVYTVSADHVYDNPGNYTVMVTVTRTDGTTASGQGTATVTGDPNPSNDLQAVGQDVNATPGTPFTATVASFFDLGVPLGTQNGDVGNYSALIDWGDNTTSSGIVEVSNLAIGTDHASPAFKLSQLLGASQVIIRDGLPSPASGYFDVVGTHTYASAGDFTISVIINRNDGATISTTSNATIQTAPSSTITATGVNFTAIVNAPFTDTVATFIDLPTLTVGDPIPVGTDVATHTYNATIDWGDNSTSAGTVVSGLGTMGASGGATGANPSNPTVLPVDGGYYIVEGTHTYSATGDFTVNVTITRDDGVTATATSTATVVPAQSTTITATGVDINESAGVQFTDTVATLSETPAMASLLQGLNLTGVKPADTTYMATIDWGDNSTSAGTLVPVPFLYGTASGGISLSPPTPVPVYSTDNPGLGNNPLPLPGSEFLVQGTHTYASTGSYKITVTITGDAGASATTTSTATVVPPPTPGTLTVNPEPVTGFAGSPVLSVVATFSDTTSQGTGSGASNPTGVLPIGAYTATIDWGDGNTSSGVVLPNYFNTPPPGAIGGISTVDVAPINADSYIVLGDHTYAAAGTFTVTVTITGTDGASGSATSTATILAAPSGTTGT